MEKYLFNGHKYNGREWENINPLDYSKLSLGDFTLDEKGTFIIPNIVSGSDYSGSTVERSNYLVFYKRFGKLKGIVWKVYGGFNTYGIAIDTTKITEEIQECLDSLEDYPVIDEDHLSNFEMGLEDETWDDFLKDDVIRYLEKKFATCENISIEDISGDALKTLLLECMEKENEYFVHETGCIVFTDVEKILQNVTIEDIKKLHVSKD